MDAQPAEWSCGQAAQWLCSRLERLEGSHAELVQRFRAQLLAENISGAVLSSIDARGFREVFGLSYGHALALEKVIRELSGTISNVPPRYYLITLFFVIVPEAVSPDLLRQILNHLNASKSSTSAHEPEAKWKIKAGPSRAWTLAEDQKLVEQVRRELNADVWTSCCYLSWQRLHPAGGWAASERTAKDLSNRWVQYRKLKELGSVRHVDPETKKEKLALSGEFSLPRLLDLLHQKYGASSADLPSGLASLQPCWKHPRQQCPRRNRRRPLELTAPADLSEKRKTPDDDTDVEAATPTASPKRRRSTEVPAARHLGSVGLHRSNTAG